MKQGFLILTLSLGLSASAATELVNAPLKLSDLDKIEGKDRYAFKYKVSGGCKHHQPKLNVVVREIIQKEKVVIEGPIAKAETDRPVRRNPQGVDIVAQLEIEDSTADGQEDHCRSIVNVRGEFQLSEIYQEALEKIRGKKVGKIENFRLQVGNRTLSYAVPRE